MLGGQRGEQQASSVRAGPGGGVRSCAQRQGAAPITGRPSCAVRCTGLSHSARAPAISGGGRRCWKGSQASSPVWSRQVAL